MADECLGARPTPKLGETNIGETNSHSGEERRLAEAKCVVSITKRYNPYDFRPDSVQVVEGFPMLKSRTHFEQVPLATVRKIIEEQLQREARTSDAIEEERPETAFAAVEEPSTAELAAFLAGRDRDDS